MFHLNKNCKYIILIIFFPFLVDDMSPIILEHPMNITIPQDEPVTLNCKASVGIKNQRSGGYSLSSNNGNSGLRPQLAIEWFKEGELVQTSSQGDPHAHRILLPDGSLFFLRAMQSKKEQDGGIYWCVASNEKGVARSNNATLEIACK